MGNRGTNAPIFTVACFLNGPKCVKLAEISLV